MGLTNLLIAGTAKALSSAASKKEGSVADTVQKVASAAANKTNTANTARAEARADNAGTTATKNTAATAYSSKMPDMSRNEALAGQTVYSNGMNVTYNDQGYATSATSVKNTGSTKAQAKEAALGAEDRAQYGGSTYDQQHFTTQELAAADNTRKLAEQGAISWQEANNIVNGIRAGYGYSGGADGSGYTPVDSAGSSVANYIKLMDQQAQQAQPASAQSVQAAQGAQGGSGDVNFYSYTGNGEIGSGDVLPGGAGTDRMGTVILKAKTPDGRVIDVIYKDGVRQTDIPDGTIVRTEGGDFVYHAPQSAVATPSTGSTARSTLVQGASGGRAQTDSVGPLTNRAPDLQSTLDKWLAAAQQQAELKVDYAVQRGVNELQRAEQDAQQQFQTERNQISADEAKARDNQALYAERRGDRGGIGAAQYDAIANTAAQNQLAVNQAQTKLSTDTARQIADLRAQGEFSKADQVLQLAQTYLQQLISIEQWASQFNLSVDQFNKELEKWNLNYEAEIAQLLGNYRGQQTLGGQQLDLQRQQLALSQQAQEFDQAYREASLTGMYNGNPTLQAKAQLAEAGIALAQAGIMPSESQLEAMKSLYGYDDSAVAGLVQTAQLAAQAKLTSGSGGGGRGSGGGGGSSYSGGNDEISLDDIGYPLGGGTTSAKDQAANTLAVGIALARATVDPFSAATSLRGMWNNLSAEEQSRVVSTLNEKGLGYLLYDDASTATLDPDTGKIHWFGKTYASANALADAVLAAEERGWIDEAVKASIYDSLIAQGLNTREPTRGGTKTGTTSTSGMTSSSNSSNTSGASNASSSSNTSTSNPLLDLFTSKSTTTSVPSNALSTSPTYTDAQLEAMANQLIAMKPGQKWDSNSVSQFLNNTNLTPTQRKQVIQYLRKNGGM